MLHAKDLAVYKVYMYIYTFHLTGELYLLMCTFRYLNQIRKWQFRGETIILHDIKIVGFSKQNKKWVKFLFIFSKQSSLQPKGGGNATSRLSKAP